MKLYPIQQHIPIRRKIIDKKSSYSLCKGELREDFSSKCGYCDSPDYYSGGRKGFHIDHFAPKSKFVDLKNDYGNLIYCCPVCNIGKGDDWPSDSSNESYLNDIGYIDPCDPLYQKNLVRNADGTIVPLTPLGRYIHKKLKLSLKRRQICWLMERMEKQMIELTRIMLQQGSNPADVDTLCKLVQEYFKYVGILKRE
ncbi:HNH endonuclease [Aeromonas caviae]|uniref:HNH endonuclease signature motif containing protein n=1 Tax=Aeromonas caviae TaxID=648 RepID=UPI001BD5327E|nr:HNH endonuclease signature motif containing protein [Aeromonas caviae]MBS4709339.1 HNH endonuclease [Aeromonas caviae]